MKSAESGCTEIIVKGVTPLGPFRGMRGLSSFAPRLASMAVGETPSKLNT